MRRRIGADSLLQRMGRRDVKHININSVINIDFVEHGKLHEVKKSRAIEEAGIWQMKYYLYYLQQRGVCGVEAQIDYPLAKKNVKVELTREDVGRMEEILKDIERIGGQKLPPAFEEKKICKKCAYHDLCFI